MEAEFMRPFSSAAALGSIEILERWNAETWRRTADDGQGWERVHRVGGDEKVGEFFITQGPNPSGTALARDEKVADIFSVYEISRSAAQLESAVGSQPETSLSRYLPGGHAGLNVELSTPVTTLFEQVL